MAMDENMRNESFYGPVKIDAAVTSQISCRWLKNKEIGKFVDTNKSEFKQIIPAAA